MPFLLSDWSAAWMLLCLLCHCLWILKCISLCFESIKHFFWFTRSMKGKHSSSTCTDRAITSMTSDRVAKRPIVDRQTRVKTLPSLAIGKYRITCKEKVPQYNSTPTDSVQIEDKTWLVFFFTVIYPPVQFYTVAMVTQLMSPGHWWDRHHRWKHLYSDTCSYRNRKQVLSWSGNRRCMYRILCLVVSGKGTWHHSNSPDSDEKIKSNELFKITVVVLVKVFKYIVWVSLLLIIIFPISTLQCGVGYVCDWNHFCDFW